MNSNEKSLDERLSKNDKLELEKLDKWGECLNTLMYYEHNVMKICDVALAVTLCYNMYAQAIHWTKAVVISVFSFFHPSILWAIKFMDINVNFKITNDMITVSGIYIGIWLIGLVLEHFIEVANFEVDSILEKYQETDDDN